MPEHSLNALPLWHYLTAFAVLGLFARLASLQFARHQPKWRVLIADCWLSALFAVIFGWMCLESGLGVPWALLAATITGYFGARATIKKHGPKVDAVIGKIIDATTGILGALKPTPEKKAGEDNDIP